MISISPSSSTTGATSTPAKLVWRRLRRVERRDPHQPVDALLGAVEAVGVLAADAEGGRLDPGLLARAGLEQLDLEAALLGPAHLHPQHHLGPVLGVGAAGAGVDRDDRVARVVGAGEEALLLEREQALLDRVELRRRARAASSSSSSRKLDERLEVLDVGGDAAEGLESARQARVLGAELRRGARRRPRSRARPSASRAPRRARRG